MSVSVQDHVCEFVRFFCDPDVSVGVVPSFSRPYGVWYNASILRLTGFKSLQGYNKYCCYEHPCACHLENTLPVFLLGMKLGVGIPGSGDMWTFSFVVTIKGFSKLVAPMATPTRKVLE